MSEIDDIRKRHETWNEQAHLMWMPDWEKCHADRATLLARVGELEGTDKNVIIGPALTSWGKKMIARVEELEDKIRRYQRMVALDTEVIEEQKKAPISEG